MRPWSDTTERCDATFKKRIRLECFDALERAGFTRFRKEGVDWPICDGFHGWVGLNTALLSDRVDILPNVGIHVVPLERLWTSLKGRKYDRGVATYAINMGLLEAAANERAFAFSPQQSEQFISSECERLARLYATPGLDYARSIASYEALLPLLRKRVDTLGAYPEKVASCLYLMDCKAEARAFVEDFLPTHSDYFRAFATPFLKLMKGKGIEENR